MKRRVLIPLLSILVASINCWGQSSVHFDKPYYFAGEYVFYSFCNSSLPSDTISARVDLYSTHGVLESYYVLIEDQCGEGYIKLPFEAKTDQYQLRITAHEIVSLSENLIASVPVSIFNDEDLSILKKDLAADEEDIDQSDEQVMRTTAKARDEVTVKVEIPPSLQSDIRRISVSVRDNNLFGAHRETVHQVDVDDPKSDLIKGIPFKGSRELINAGPIRNHLLFAFNAEDMVFDGVGVDMSTDKFDLVLTSFFDRRRISFLDYLSNEIEITRRPPTPFEEFPGTLRADVGILDHMEIYREEKQINRIFRQIGLNLSQDTSEVERPDIRPNYHVDVQDYTIRGTTVSLFKELSTSLKFRSIGKDEYRAAVVYERNGITKFFSRAPLFLVNGSSTRDGRFIAGLPLQEIAFFSIYSEYDMLEGLSPMALGGIVYVDMIDRNYVLPKQEALPAFTLQGLQVPIQYPLGITLRSDGPSVGSLLYWNPSISWQGSSLAIPIQGGDIASEYIVEVVLHLSNPGRVHVIRQILELEVN